MRTLLTGYTRPLFTGDTSTTGNAEELTTAGARSVIIEPAVASRTALQDWIGHAKPGAVLLVTDRERHRGPR